MKFFWPIYFLTVVVSTAGVYMAAPLARPYVEAVFGPRDGVRPEAQGGVKPGMRVLKTAAAAPSLEVEEPAPRRPETSAVADEDAPARNGIYLALSGDKPGWGITFQRANYYGLNGARFGHVPAGVLLDYRNTRVSSIGTMVECVMQENGTPSPLRLISRKDVYLYTGTYTKLSAKQRADLQAYYTLSGKIDMRKTELLQAAAAKNPFFVAYNQAYRNYTALIDAAKELKAKRDRATELDKTRLEDQLREMKVAETALRAEYDATHAKFRVWKEQHAHEIVKAENDPDAQKWSQEMVKLRLSIPGLVY